jgi:hypothetical protein
VNADGGAAAASAIQWGDQVQVPVAHAEGAHRDERAVVGPERDPQIHLEHVVRSKQEPVSAAAR